jgi:hypothetical protein
LASHSEDEIFENCHDSSTDHTRDGNGDKPGHKNVSEKSPVNSFLGSEPANRYNRAHLGKKQTKETLLKCQKYFSKKYLKLFRQGAPDN